MVREISVMLRRWGVLQDNLVLSTGLIMWIDHRKEIQKLAFPALVPRLSKTIRSAEGLTLETWAFGSEKDITTGLGRWSPAWSWTEDYSAQDQATPAWGRSQSAVLAPGMSDLCFKQARPHIWKGKCCFTALIFYPSASVDGLAIAVTTSLGNKIVYSGRNDSDHRQGEAIMMSRQ